MRFAVPGIPALRPLVEMAPIICMSGLMLKMKFLPNKLKKNVRLVHAFPPGIALLALILILGHSIMD